MSSRTKILRDARQRLRKKEITAEEQEKFLNLLDLLTASLGDSVLQNEDFATLLVETVLDNGNLVTILEHQAAELDALKRITVNLTSSLELQVVLDGVVKEAMQLVKGAQDTQIFLNRDERLVFGASLKFDGEKNIQHANPRPDGLTYNVARERKMMIVEDMKTHPLYADAHDTWAGSIISIPLMMGNRIVGVMNLARKQPGEFSQSEVRLLTLLADQAAIAISNAHFHSTVNQQAHSDALTNLPNRRALDERLEDEIARSNRSRRSFSVIMMDLDGFKSVNDSYGHDAGDEVLRQVATSLAQTLRITDFLARYGGDEMTLILPETDLSQAAHVARKLQNRLHLLSIPLPGDKTVSMGFSGGIALFPNHADTASGLLRAADEALYRAKKHARGTCVAAREPTGELKIPRNIHSGP